MDYPAIAYDIKTEDDGSIVRYNYRWNDTGEALSEEEIALIEDFLKRHAK